MLTMRDKMSEALPSVSFVPDAASRAGWEALRALVRAQQPLLCAPWPSAPGLCGVCRGPAAGRGARCFPCDLHSQCAQGSLADLVVPVAFAVKGGAHARQLWQYKSARPGARAGEAAAQLRALLLVFLRDHGHCLWQAASGRGPGLGAGPTHLAVVPTARGRPGPHPLRALVDPYTSGQWAELSARPGGQQVRDLDPDRFVAAPVPGARVLLLDDTWTTGSSAQSAAMALRRAGARQIVTVILGRHVAPGWAGPGAAPFRPESCAVHQDCDVPR